MIDSASHVIAPRSGWHCLVAADDYDVVAECSYHVLRLGFTVSTIASDADVFATVVQRAPHLLIVSAAVAAECRIARRDLREATGRWDLGLVIVRFARDPDAHLRERVGADAVLTLPASARDIMATFRRVAERMAEQGARLADRAGGPPFAVRREAREVRVHDRWVRLSEHEFRVVEALLRSPTGLSDLALEDQVWGTPQRSGFRGLVTVMARLRKKLLPYGAGVERVPALAGYRLRW